MTQADDVKQVLLAYREGLIWCWDAIDRLIELGLEPDEAQDRIAEIDALWDEEDRLQQEET